MHLFVNCTEPLFEERNLFQLMAGRRGLYEMAFAVCPNFIKGLNSDLQLDADLDCGDVSTTISSLMPRYKPSRKLC